MCNYDWSFFLIDICVYCDANLWKCFLIDIISNSKASERIGSPQSPVVDLVVEVEEEDPSPTTNVKRNSSPPIEIVNGNETGDAKGKKKCTSDVWIILIERKLMGNLNLSVIIVASITWVILKRVQDIYVFI